MTVTPDTDRPTDLAERLVAAAGDAIVIADPHGRILAWNKGAETTFGYTADEALGKSLDLIIPEKLRARHWDGYHQTMQTGTTRHADELLAVPALRADGTRISIEFRVTLLIGPDQNPEAIAAVIRDVTARWQADRELRQELTRLRALVDNAAERDDDPKAT